MRVRGVTAKVTGLLLVLSVAVAVPLVAGCGGSRSPTYPADVPMVTLGRYTFGPKSATIKHPWLVAGRSTGTVEYAVFGYVRSPWMTLTYSNGGSVKGVATVRVVPGYTVGRRFASWLAQDQQGNVHILQMETGRSTVPQPELVGVAAGRKPWFYLPSSAVLKPGYTWYGYLDNKAARRYQVVSAKASIKGKRGLLRVQTILAATQAGFQPIWQNDGGQRRDYYFEPNRGVYVEQWGADAGYVRK
jgi:hypothetical protein